MAGVPDRSLEKRVATILRRKDMQDASDREIARKAECGKNFVRVVRARMIARGEIPPPAAIPNSRYEVYGTAPVKIRGGYVLNGTKIERETRYYPPVKPKKKPPAGRATRSKK